VIQKLFGYEDGGIKYMFLKDGRFTIVYGKSIESDKVMFGTAFCTRMDEYRTDIGCHIALKRFCDNLRFDREQRVKAHEKLDSAIEEYYNNQITNYLKEGE